MTSKRARRSGGTSKKVDNLPARALKADQARGVKGGIIINYRAVSGKILPEATAVQKVRE